MSDRSVLEELAAQARRKSAGLIKKRRRLVDNLEADLIRHGEPEIWKRFGDLLLANIGTAERAGDRVIVTDYFDELAPKVEIEADANKPLTEVAESYFRRYTKARNGKRVIKERIKQTESEIAAEEARLEAIAAAFDREDETYLAALVMPPPPPKFAARKKKRDVEFKGARRFVSSDGFEVLVGKKAADNDFLTFRIAKSLDLWLHAADYPGSHVVVRRAGKTKIPSRTLLEAAELAAFYSDAREHPKAAVNYTERKFVNKPKRSAPGLVSLSSFRTILVEPRISIPLVSEGQDSRTKKPTP